MASNFLIDSLGSRDREALRPHLREIALPLGAVLFEPDDRVDRVIFPTSGLVSLISVLSNGDSVETSVVGRESGLGFLEAVGSRTIHSRVLVQAAGRALAIPTQAFVEVFNASEKMRTVLRGHCEVLMAEVRQEIACARAHVASQRLARFILTCLDKSGETQLSLTQEALAAMMGCQRTTVTQVAHDLKARKVLRYTRGRIQICDPIGLRAASCECYDVMRDYRSQMAEPVRAAPSDVALAAVI